MKFKTYRLTVSM